MQCAKCCEHRKPKTKNSPKPLGRPKKLQGSKQQRRAAKQARKLMKTQAAELTDKSVADEKEKRVRTIRDLWKAFDWAPELMSNLPGKKLRANMGLREKRPQGWATLRRRAKETLKVICSILYPAAPEELLESIARDMVPGAKTNYEKLEKAILDHFKASPVGSLERRAYAAIAVKGLTVKRRKVLRESGLVIGSSAETTAYKDSKSILEGSILGEIKHRTVRERAGPE